MYTGYTHQWKSARLRDVTQFCQVSADSCGDIEKAEKLGIRGGSFRVRPLDPTHPDHAIRADEIVCPASKEADYVTNCASCGMCSGSTGKRIAILAHGIGKKFVAPKQLPVLRPNHPKHVRARIREVFEAQRNAVAPRQ